MKRTNKIAAAVLATVMAGSALFTGCNLGVEDFDDSVAVDRAIKQGDTSDGKADSEKKVAVSDASWVFLKAKDEAAALYAKATKPFEKLKGVKGGTTKLVGLLLGAADTEKCTPFEKTVLSIGGKVLTSGAKMVDALIDKFTYGMGSAVIDFFWPDAKTPDPVQTALADIKKSIDGISTQITELDATILNMFTGQYKQNHFVEKGTLNTTLTKAGAIIKNANGNLTYHDYTDLVNSLPVGFSTNLSKYYVNYVNVKTPYTLPMGYRLYAEKTYPFRWQSNNMLKALLAQDLADGTKYMVIADEIMNPFKPNVALNTLIAAVDNKGYNLNSQEKVQIMDDICKTYLSYEAMVNKSFQNGTITEEECLKQKLMYIADMAKDPSYSQKSGKDLYQLYVEALEAVMAEYEAITADYDKYVEAIDFDIIPKQEAGYAVINYFPAGNNVEYVKVKNESVFLNYGKSLCQANIVTGGLSGGEKDKVLHGMIPLTKRRKSSRSSRYRLVGWKNDAPYEKLMTQEVVEYVIKAYEKMPLTDGTLTKVKVDDSNVVITKEEGKEVTKNIGNILRYDCGFLNSVYDNNFKLVLLNGISLDIGNFNSDIKFNYFDLGPNGKAGVQKKTISSKDYKNYDDKFHEFRTFRFTTDRFNYNVQRY